MRTVKFHTVKTNLTGSTRSTPEGINHILDVFFGHGFGNFFAGNEKSGRSRTGKIGAGRSLLVAHRANMPELRHDFCATFMRFRSNTLPALKRLGAMKSGDRVRHGGDPVINCRALGNNQACTAFCTTPVISCNIGTRHFAGGKIAGHRCHRNSVWYSKAVESERGKQFVQRMVHKRNVLEICGEGKFCCSYIAFRSPMIKTINATFCVIRFNAHVLL